MAKLNLVVGSMLGAAEYVADHVASLLEQAGHQAEIHNPASLAEVLAEPEAILLVVTSTHGAGDVPDNLQPFAKDLAEQYPDLKTLKYGVIALGDSSYDTFCQGGKTLDRLLAECGASRIGDRLDIDVTQHEIPEDAAEGVDPGLVDIDRLNGSGRSGKKGLDLPAYPQIAIHQVINRWIRISCSTPLPTTSPKNVHNYGVKLCKTYSYPCMRSITASLCV